MPKIDESFWENVTKIADRLAQARNKRTRGFPAQPLGATAYQDRAIQMLLGQRANLAGAGQPSIPARGGVASWLGKGTPAYGAMQPSQGVSQYELAKTDLLKARTGQMYGTKPGYLDELRAKLLEAQTARVKRPTRTSDVRIKEMGRRLSYLEKKFPLTADDQAEMETIRKIYYPLIGVPYQQQGAQVQQQGAQVQNLPEEPGMWETFKNRILGIPLPAQKQNIGTMDATIMAFKKYKDPSASWAIRDKAIDILLRQKLITKEEAEKIRKDKPMDEKNVQK